MSKQEKITTILTTALFYTVITSIFSLFQRLSTLVIAQGTPIDRISWFLQRNTLWIIVVSSIIITLITFIKKSNPKVSVVIAANPIVGLTTGILVILDGISNFASTLPMNIMSVRSVFESLKHVDVFPDRERIISQALISNVLSIVIILCQIVFGFYMIKAYKKRSI